MCFGVLTQYRNVTDRQTDGHRSYINERMQMCDKKVVSVRELSTIDFHNSTQSNAKLFIITPPDSTCTQTTIDHTLLSVSLSVSHYGSVRLGLV